MDTSLSTAELPHHDPSLYRDGARLCKAMGHPSRLLIIDALASGPLCASELTQRIGCDASTVSSHLNILRGAGLLRDERRGTHIYYQLADRCILSVFDCLARFGVAPAQIAASRLSPPASPIASNSHAHEIH